MWTNGWELKPISKLIQWIRHAVNIMVFSRINTGSLIKSDFWKTQMTCLHWLEDDTLVIFNLQPTWIVGLSKCKIRSSDLCHSLRLFKTKTTTPLRQIYINCSSSNLERKFWKGIWNFMVKTCFQWKVNVATRTRAMRVTQWYQSFEELMKESTYWSWVAELWNWTSMEQYMARFLKVIVWLALGKSRKVNW